MSIIRAAHDGNNYYKPLSSKRLQFGLSPEAIGVLDFLLDQADGWEPTANWLHGAYKMHNVKIGKSKLQRILNELKEKGFLIIAAVRDSLGRFVKWATKICEVPMQQEIPIGNNVTVDVRGNFHIHPGQLKTLTQSASSPDPHFPDLDCPDLENRAQTNNIDTTKKKSKTKISPLTPQGEWGQELKSFEKKSLEQQPEQETRITPSHAQDPGLGKYSAPAARRRTDKAALLGLSQEDYQLFYQRMLLWAGERDGVISVAGFVRSEIEAAIEAGGVHPRLEEFRAGEPLGIRDKEEWQVAIAEDSGVCRLEIHSDALEYWISLEQGKEQGLPRTVAAERVATKLRQKATVSLMWEEYKAHLALCRDEALKQQQLGASGLGAIPSPILNRSLGLGRPKKIELEEAEAAALQLAQIACGSTSALPQQPPTPKLPMQHQNNEDTSSTLEPDWDAIATKEEAFIKEQLDPETPAVEAEVEHQLRLKAAATEATPEEVEVQQQKKFPTPAIPDRIRTDIAETIAENARKLNREKVLGTNNRKLNLAEDKASLLNQLLVSDRKFVEELIDQNPKWGLEICDATNIVKEVEF